MRKYAICLKIGNMFLELAQDKDKVSTKATAKTYEQSQERQPMFWDRQMKYRKSSVRYKAEHPFLIVKKQSGCAKVVYRGIARNMNRFHILFASANPVMCARVGRSRDFCRA